MNRILFILWLSVLPLLAGCNGTPAGQESQQQEEQQQPPQPDPDPDPQPDPDPDPVSEDGLEVLTLEELSGDIINPERGFYQPSHFQESSSALSVSQSGPL